MSYESTKRSTPGWGVKEPVSDSPKKMDRKTNNLSLPDRRRVKKNQEKRRKKLTIPKTEALLNLPEEVVKQEEAQRLIMARSAQYGKELIPIRGWYSADNSTITETGFSGTVVNLLNGIQVGPNWNNISGNKMKIASIIFNYTITAQSLSGPTAIAIFQANSKGITELNPANIWQTTGNVYSAMQDFNYNQRLNIRKLAYRFVVVQTVTSRTYAITEPIVITYKEDGSTIKDVDFNYLGTPSNWGVYLFVIGNQVSMNYSYLIKFRTE